MCIIVQRSVLKTRVHDRKKSRYFLRMYHSGNGSDETFDDFKIYYMYLNAKSLKLYFTILSSSLQYLQYTSETLNKFF